MVNRNRASKCDVYSQGLILVKAARCISSMKSERLEEGKEVFR